MHVKKIYFVRHGESESNCGTNWPDNSTSLTNKGRKQSVLVADFFLHIPVGIILTSTMRRSMETAEMLAQKITVPIEYTNLLVERQQPSQMRGKPKDDNEARNAEQTIQEHFHIPGFRLGDEENFEDVRNRAKTLMHYLASRSENFIVAITHGFFLRVLLAHIIFTDQLTGKLCMEIVRRFHVDNAGVSLVHYDTWQTHSQQWKVLYWNDTNHLKKCYTDDIITTLTD